MEEDFWADTLVAGVKAEMVGKKRAARMSFMVVKSATKIRRSFEMLELEIVSSLEV